MAVLHIREAGWSQPFKFKAGATRRDCVANPTSTKPMSRISLLVLRNLPISGHHFDR
jgi:hypothetical protein